MIFPKPLQKGFRECPGTPGVKTHKSQGTCGPPMGHDDTHGSEDDGDRSDRLSSSWSSCSRRASITWLWGERLRQLDDRSLDRCRGLGHLRRFHSNIVAVNNRPWYMWTGARTIHIISPMTLKLEDMKRPPGMYFPNSGCHEISFILLSFKIKSPVTVPTITWPLF